MFYVAPRMKFDIGGVFLIPSKEKEDRATTPMTGMKSPLERLRQLASRPSGEGK